VNNSINYLRASAKNIERIAKAMFAKLNATSDELCDYITSAELEGRFII
jgi:hypothetical protein